MSDPVRSSSSGASPPSLLGEGVAEALRSLIWVLWGTLGVLAGIYLASGITFVAPGENALILRFGRLLPTVHSPGLVMAWPRPIDVVVRVPGGQMLEIEVADWQPASSGGGAGQPIPRAAFHPWKHGYTLTGDRNILQGIFTIRYRVTDPAAYALGWQNPQQAMRDILLQALTQELSTVRVDAVLVEERQVLAVRTRDRAQVTSDRLGLGVEWIAVEIRQLVPPVWVASAFAEVVNARIEADTLLQEAKDEKARRLPEAEGVAFRTREEARSQALERVRQAQAEADAFAEIRRAAEEDMSLFMARRHLETLAVVRPRLRAMTLLTPQSPPAGLWLHPTQSKHFSPLPAASLPTLPAAGTSRTPFPLPQGIEPEVWSVDEGLPPDPATELEEITESLEQWEEVPLPTWESREEP